jgi:hypothetical protein
MREYNRQGIVPDQKGSPDLKGEENSILMERDYSVEEIERLRGIPQHVIRYWIRNGLPARRVSNIYLITLEDLDKFMQERVEIQETKPRYVLKRLDGQK